MNPFLRVALWYLGIVCVLTWFRDDPVATASILIIALLALAIRRGMAAKFLRAVYRLLKATMKTNAKEDQHDESRELISQWNKFIDGAQVRPLQFYAVLEEKLARRRIPKIRCSRQCLPESGPLSAKREYLTIRRKNLEFYICGAPFGSGFFVSSRLIKQDGLTLAQKIIAVLAYLFVVGVLIRAFGVIAVELLVASAIVGAIYAALRANDTCYEEDMAESFRRAVHNSVLEAMDELTTVRSHDHPACDAVGAAHGRTISLIRHGR